MIIWGSSVSPFVRKVLVFAAEKGLEFESRPTRIGEDNPEFRRVSPFGKMPALTDGDFGLADSSAIAHYLDAQYPGPRLIPDEPRLRGQVVWWDEFGDTILAACGGKMFFNRVVAPKFLGREGDQAVADAAERDELPPLLDYLESVVTPGGWLVGDTLTLADISVASSFANLEHAGYIPDTTRHPRLTAWVAGMLARPSFAAVVDKERRFLSR